MDKIFRDLYGKGVEIYIDDIIIHAKESKEHDRLLGIVLERLRKRQMRVNPDKVQHKQPVAKILGVTIDGKSQRMNEVKRNEALEYPRPRNVSELRRFLGLTGWFRGFIKDYAGLSRRLSSALTVKTEFCYI